MSRFGRFRLSVLLLVVALVLASCAGSGNSGAGQQEQGNSSGSAKEEESDSMQGMDHGEMSGVDMDEMARQLVMPNGEYSDVAFVDAMVPHHEGAVEIAQVALDNAEHEEIRQLSHDIISAQRAEIDLLSQIREKLAGSTTGMSQEEMEEMSEDPRQLAQKRPFDKAFIDTMIPHHESAISMANVALEESDDPEILGIGEDIVSAQEREISQMKQWREDWYPEDA